MSRPRARRRGGLTLTDVIAASGLAVVIVGAGCAEVARQLRDLAAARDDARALAALRAVGERLRTGALAAPAAGLAAALDGAPAGLTLTAARDPGALDERLVERGLVAVVVRAAWKDEGGRPTARQLVVVVPADGRGR